MRKPMFFLFVGSRLESNAEPLVCMPSHFMFTLDYETYLAWVCFQLLEKDTSKRLGCGPLGSDEIKRHKWFKPINWKKLDTREIQPSFRPDVAGQHCIANFEKCWTDMPLVDSPAASPNASGNPFSGFSYVRPAASFLQN